MHQAGEKAGLTAPAALSGERGWEAFGGEFMQPVIMTAYVDAFIRRFEADPQNRELAIKDLLIKRA